MARVSRFAVIVAMAGTLSAGGCASVVEGTNQKLALHTNPQGAHCTLSRQGQTVAIVAQTPGEVTVSKSRHALQVRCELEGYDATVASVDSEFQAMTLGNLVAGGLIGFAVDAGTGAMNKYEPTITIPMQPLGTAPSRVNPVPSAPAPATSTDGQQPVS